MEAKVQNCWICHRSTQTLLVDDKLERAIGIRGIRAVEVERPEWTPDEGLCAKCIEEIKQYGICKIHRYGSDDMCCD